jgi:ribosomal protein S18 acetylase RimI-like enzyme
VSAAASVLVRPAVARDLDRVAALWTLLLAYHEGAPGLAPARDAGDALRRHVAALAGDPAAALFVAEREGALLGFAVARLLRRPPLFRETERGEIEALFVREEARRAGSGRALADAALAWMAARGLRRAALQVAAGNEAGQRFWRALGFAAAMDVLERPL